VVRFADRGLLRRLQFVVLPVFRYEIDKQYHVFHLFILAMPSSSVLSPTVAIVKYNAGNVHSVTSALHRCGVEPLLTDSPDELRAADKVIFPGVGEARSAMKYLRDNHLDRVIASLTQPVLGVCVGMQLLCEHSEENDTACMGVFPVKLKRFAAPPASGLKVPHIGWNQVSGLRSPLFAGIDEQAFVYFVHSYRADASPLAIATTDYITPFSAALQQGNFYGVQFHPEKSGAVGEQIYHNFVAL
jgi:imidazole glycerol-phosphate synthase subunit HisH